MRCFAASQRADAAAARNELRDYLRLLRIADLQEARIVSSGNRRRRSSLEPLRSDSKYEKALERLRELTAAKPSLLAQLDRQFDPWNSTPTDSVAADKEHMPRLRYGDGANANAIASISQLRIDALEAAIGEEEAVATIEGIDAHLKAELDKLRALVRR